MEKTKLYKSPEVEVFKIETGNLLAGSGSVTECSCTIGIGFGGSSGGSGGGRSREGSMDDEA
ncbi:MAG: hypothetical protein IJ527_04245 [Prevotella sp.]|nr:hypothetical protein [Prevotella sp.]